MSELLYLFIMYSKWPTSFLHRVHVVSSFPSFVFFASETSHGLDTLTENHMTVYVGALFLGSLFKTSNFVLFQEYFDCLGSLEVPDELWGGFFYFHKNIVLDIFLF